MEKCSDVAIRISKLEDENEILREQVETLKKELHCMHQELKLTKNELSCTNHELFTALMLEYLELDKAKELAKVIVESNNSVSESLTELNTAIYGSLVKPEELEQMNNLSITKESLKGVDGNRIVAKSKEILAKLEYLAAQCNELGGRYVRFNARFMEKKKRFKHKKKVVNNLSNNHFKSNYLSYSPPPRVNAVTILTSN